MRWEGNASTAKNTMELQDETKLDTQTEMKAACQLNGGTVDIHGATEHMLVACKMSKGRRGLRQVDVGDELRNRNPRTREATSKNHSGP